MDKEQNNIPHLCPTGATAVLGARDNASGCFPPLKLSPFKRKIPVGLFDTLEENPSSEQHPAQGRPAPGRQDSLPGAGKVLFLLFIYIHLAVNSPAGEPAVHTNKHVFGLRRSRWLGRHMERGDLPQLFHKSSAHTRFVYTAACKWSPSGKAAPSRGEAKTSDPRRPVQITHQARQSLRKLF